MKHCRQRTNPILLRALDALEREHAEVVGKIEMLKVAIAIAAEGGWRMEWE